LIIYKVDNITPIDDEKTFLVDVSLEMVDYESDTDTVYISMSFPLANDSNDLVEIKEKAILKAKNMLKQAILEDAQQDLF